LRRIRDRCSRRHQLPAFNTAAGEKINADRHLWHSPKVEAEAYGKAFGCAFSNQIPARL
jgi:hypothetical protein